MWVRQAAWFGAVVAAVVSLEAPVSAFCLRVSLEHARGDQMLCGVDCWLALPDSVGVGDGLVNLENGQRVALRRVRDIVGGYEPAGLYHAEGVLLPGDWSVELGSRQATVNVLPRGEPVRTQVLDARDAATDFYCNDTPDVFGPNDPPPVQRNRLLLPSVRVRYDREPAMNLFVAWDVWVLPTDAQGIVFPADNAQPEPAPLLERAVAPDWNPEQLVLVQDNAPRVSGGERFRVCVRPHFPDGQTGELLCTVIQAVQADEGPGCTQTTAAPLGLSLMAMWMLRARRRRFSRAS